MILRLSGADFSSNNIGKIQVIRELKNETKRLLSNYTKKLTEVQKHAVQEFVDGLKEKGIWQYLGNLYLPILANSLEEVMLNVKTLRNDYNNPDTTFYKLGIKGGLTTKNIENIPTSSRIIVNLNASQLNHHVMVYPLQVFNDSGEEGLFWLSGHNAQRTILLDTKKWKTNSSDGNKNIFDSSGQPVVNANGNVLVGLDFLTDKPYAINGTVENSLYTGGYDEILADNTYTNEPVHILTNFNTRAKNEYGLISLGTGIPAESLDIYGELAKKFFDSMMA